MRSPYLCSLLLLALPLASWAQSAPAPAPRFFGGLGASVGTYQLPGTFGVNVAAPVLTAGVQLCPRWALQAGAAYAQEKTAYNYYGFGYADGRLGYGSDAGATRRRTVAVPVRLRYTATNPARRFRFDVLAGVALVHSAVRTAGTRGDSAQTAFTPYDQASAATGLYATLGPGVRYALGPRWDVTGEFVFHELLNNPASSRYPSRLSATAAVGMLYRFGYR